jgi:chlorite dismutase
MYESIHETVIKETPPPAPSAHSSSFEASVREERRFKKGKTRMPKRLVRQEAIMDLGYPFDEEDDFYVLRIALEKEQIDEVIKISETYKDGGTFTPMFDSVDDELTR